MVIQLMVSFEENIDYAQREKKAREVWRTLKAMFKKWLREQYISYWNPMQSFYFNFDKTQFGIIRKEKKEIYKEVPGSDSRSYICMDLALLHCAVETIKSWWYHEVLLKCLRLVVMVL